MASCPQLYALLKKIVVQHSFRQQKQGTTLGLVQEEVEVAATSTALNTRLLAKDLTHYMTTTSHVQPVTHIM